LREQPGARQSLKNPPQIYPEALTQSPAAAGPACRPSHDTWISFKSVALEVLSDIKHVLNEDAGFSLNFDSTQKSKTKFLVKGISAADAHAAAMRMLAANPSLDRKYIYIEGGNKPTPRPTPTHTPPLPAHNNVGVKQVLDENERLDGDDKAPVEANYCTVGRCLEVELPDSLPHRCRGAGDMLVAILFECSFIMTKHVAAACAQQASSPSRP
jgi:hypothetical protein